MNMDEFKEFKQWQAFQEMKEKSKQTPPPPPPPAFSEFVPKSFAQIIRETHPAPPPPPPAPAPRLPVARGGGSVASEDSVFSRPPNKFDYDWLLRWTIQMTPYRGDGWSEHPNLFLLYQHLYEAYPERFSVASEIHADDEGRTYFSYRYAKPGDKGNSTFHAYGHFVGRKFLIDSVDIRIGIEEYPDAAKFNQKKYND